MTLPTSQLAQLIEDVILPRVEQHSRGHDQYGELRQVCAQTRIILDRVRQASELIESSSPIQKESPPIMEVARDCRVSPNGWHQYQYLYQRVNRKESEIDGKETEYIPYDYFACVHCLDYHLVQVPDPSAIEDE